MSKYKKIAISCKKQNTAIKLLYKLWINQAGGDDEFGQ